MSAIEECCYTCECGRVVCRDNEPGDGDTLLCDDCCEAAS